MTRAIVLATATGLVALGVTAHTHPWAAWVLAAWGAVFVVTGTAVAAWAAGYREGRDTTCPVCAAADDVVAAATAITRNAVEEQS